jgi:3-oxoacyl-[acyl-carrier protein] reductase
MRLEGKKAIVTGGSTGIGLEVVDIFCREGADVVFTCFDNPEESLEIEKRMAEKYGRRAISVQTDVTKYDQVQALVKRAMDEFGRIDILVTSAGILQRIKVEDVTNEDWHRIIDVNLHGTWYCIKEVLPIMLKQEYGRIITISSQIGQKGSAELVHYAASKGAIIAMTKSLARAVSTRGVLVNSVAPGPVMTTLTTLNFADTIESDKKGLPLGRQEEAFEIAPSVLFLASSPDGDTYCGQTLGPNSGDVML